MGAWRTETTVGASPDDVLALLTDVESVSRWSPVDFEVEDLAGGRLVSGTRVRVLGRLSGYQVGFDVDVFEADAGRLVLRASGPIDIDVEYHVRPHDDGAHVSAAVSVHSRGGLRGLALSRATEALLAAGALKVAVGRIARQVEVGSTSLALAA